MTIAQEKLARARATRTRACYTHAQQNFFVILFLRLARVTRNCIFIYFMIIILVQEKYSARYLTSYTKCFRSNPFFAFCNAKFTFRFLNATLQKLAWSTNDAGVFLRRHNWSLIKEHPFWSKHVTSLKVFKMNIAKQYTHQQKTCET